MPRILLPTLPALLAVLLLTVPVAQAKPLKRGSHGPRVAKLQRALHLSPADGVFGAVTVRAVRRFQRRHRLPADGLVGAATWDMIRRSQRAARAASAAPRARVRSRGSAVSQLQRRLRIADDGVFGPGTARAVRGFQRSHGLTADGIVGPGTWAALSVHGRQPVLRRAGRSRGASGAGRTRRILARAVAAGDRIATLPYLYGGGHRSFRASGYDCSGSVSYVLHGIGRLGRPLDSGSLMSYGAPGRGRHVTIYANPGHAFMVIDGRRFDTTGRGETGSRWQPRGRSTAGYVARHPPGL
jgi:peptidoglycan hydrolase-like protein with peptidoglycan-binding domain